MIECQNANLEGRGHLKRLGRAIGRICWELQAQPLHAEQILADQLGAAILQGLLQGYLKN